jgi:hypothetical protein
MNGEWHLAVVAERVLEAVVAVRAIQVVRWPDTIHYIVSRHSRMY